MRPTLFEIPWWGATLQAYPTMIALAVVVCLAIGPWWAERLEGLPRGRVFRALVWVGVATFVGGHLHFLFGTWLGSGADDGWRWGLHAAGAIVGLTVASLLVPLAFGLPIGKFVDGLAPTVGIGIFAARLGCLLRGCCFGALCEGAFCIRFPSGSMVHALHATYGQLPAGATVSAPVYPLQIYFAASALLVTLVALLARPRKRYDGQVALLALLTFSGSAAALEFLRADVFPRAYWGPLPQLAWVALGLTATSVVGLATGGWFARPSRRVP